MVGTISEKAMHFLATNQSTFGFGTMIENVCDSKSGDVHANSRFEKTIRYHQQRMKLFEYLFFSLATCTTPLSNIDFVRTVS